MSSSPASVRHLRAGSGNTGDGSPGPTNRGQEEKPAYINDLESLRAWPGFGRSSGGVRKRSLRGVLRSVFGLARRTAPYIAIGGRLQPSCGRTDAETTHPLQKKNARLPQRPPREAEAVPGGVGPVVVGDRPPPRDLSPHGEAVVKGRGAAPFPASDGTAGPGRRPGARLHIRRVGSGAPVAPLTNSRGAPMSVSPLCTARIRA